MVKAITFTDVRFLPRSLEDFGARKAYVLFFVSATCPLVSRLLPRVARLDADFAPRGVQFVAVNVGRADSIQAMATQAIETDAPFPFVKDFDHSVMVACGVDRTCTAVVLDGKRRLRYRGRVDGAFRFSGPSPDPGREDLRAALEDVLAGRTVQVPTTPVEGCKVDPRPRPLPLRAVTWAGEIADIVDRHCVECHRDGGEAPFSLQTYGDCADRAAMIGEVVAQRRMPPWHASEKYGTFANERTLPAGERRALLAWVAAGAPLGDPARVPEPRTFVDHEWRIGEPDLVLKVPVPVRLPAEGYVPYRYYLLPYHFRHDTWVRAIEIRPDNKKVLHHANLGYVTGGLRFSQDQFITGQVPGGPPMQLPDGVAVRIPAGARLGLQCHYVTTGREEIDRLRVGLVFARGTVRKRLRCLVVNNNRFAIPPGAAAHAVRRTRTLPYDAVGIGLFAHMHLRGRDMTFRAFYPDGRAETLLMIPTYSFDWQAAYRWPPGAVRLPAGTRIEVTAHFDNSAFNPFNPDPTATVRFGQQTHHEMMYGFVFHLAAGEDLGLQIDPETGHVR